MNSKIRQVTVLGPVYICHGAENELCHVLSLAGGDDSPWVNHQVTCLEIAGDPAHAISLEPELGEFQTLAPTGASFKLHCPATGEDRDLEMRVASEFTAPALVIPLKLGHYRCEFADLRPPIGAPIVGQTVTATVRLVSFYTQQPAKNVEVVWTFDGKDTTVATDAAGDSEFTQTVMNEGEQTITVSVHNLYDDQPISTEFRFTGYLESPWQQAKLIVNGAQAAFGDPVALIRGQANVVKVQATADIARQLTLELAEAGGLTVQAVPAFQTPVDPQGGEFTWQVTPQAGASGVVTLAFGSEQVERPWERRCWVMSVNLADEVDKVLVNGVESPPTQVLFYRNEAQTVTLTYKAGSPLNTFPLKMTGTPLTGVQPSNLSVTPAGEANVNSWTVKSHTNSGTFQLELLAAESITGIKLPVCSVMARYLREEVQEFRVDGVAYPVEAVFFRGTPRTITLVYKEHSPLRGRALVLNAIALSGLQPGDLKTTLVSADPHSWKVEASNRSGTFKLQLAGEGFTQNLETAASKVLSSHLADEMELKLNKLPVPADPFVEARKPFELSLTPKNAMADIPVSLKYISGSGIDKSKFTVTPPFDGNTTSYAWAITANIDTAATFKLALQSAIVGMAGPIEFSSKVYANPPQISFAGKLVATGDNVQGAMGGRHALLVDSTGSGYERTRVKVELVGDGALGEIIPATWLTMDPTAKFNFDAVHTKTGSAQLKFTFEDRPESPVVLNMSIAKELPVFNRIVPDRVKFIANELGYFHVYVEAKNHPSVMLTNIAVRGLVLGIPVNFADTDRDGFSRVPVQLAAGDYTLKAYVLSYDGVAQETTEIPFIVHPQ